MRFIRLLIAFACLMAGAVVGALNRDLIHIDFAIATVTTNLGVGLLVALLIGVLVGGLVISASVVLPLRRRLARAERQHVMPTASPDA